MIRELENIIINLDQYLDDRKNWTSLLIDRYPPVIHRLSYKISEDRTLLLHKLFNCEDQKALMHSHSWDLACKIIEGGYEMGIGFSSDRNNPPKATFSTFIKPGDIYEIIDSDVWHYTKCLTDVKFSYSILLIGSRKRERLALNTNPLTDEQCNELFNYFSKKL